LKIIPIILVKPFLCSNPKDVTAILNHTIDEAGCQSFVLNDVSDYDLINQIGLGLGNMPTCVRKTDNKE
jgi:hypothetical protein